MATVRLQLRRGTDAQWDAANPTLAAGEIGIETDTNTFKFGDGSTPWNSLSYALAQTVDDYILLTTKGVANGVASLDSSGFIPSAQLPPLAKVTVSSAANQAARLALTAEPGDIAIQSDNGTTYVLASSPASTNGNWREISATAAISAAIATHEADTTSVHGIADTSVLATATTVATAKSEAIAAAASAAGTALSTHEADTTNVHGIANTALLATTANVATAKAEAILAAETYTDAFVGAAPGALNSLAELATALGSDANFSTTITNSIALKSPLASPTFTGTVVLPATTSVGNVTSVEIGYLNDVTSPIQGQIDAKAPLASPTLTGTVTLPESTSIGEVSNLEIGYLNGVTSGIQGQIDAKLATATAASTYAPLASPTLTGTVTLPESTSIGNVSNLEIGYLNNVTSSIQGQIDAKAPLASPTFTGTVTLPANTISQSMMSDDSVGTAEIIASSVTSSELAVDAVTEAKIADGAVTSAKIATGTIVNEDINASAAIATSKISGLDTALGLLAPIASPTFTGTVSGITKTMVGLGSVDNTADTAKPISTATQTALDLKETVANVALKAPLASPALTGVPTAPTAAAATNTTQIATTAYVRGEVAALVNSAGATLDTLGEIATALGNDANLSTTLTTAIGLKAPIASPTFTGTVTIPAGASISGFAPLASPTFTGTNTVAALTASGLITASASGVAFTDGTQTKAGIPSLTTIGTEISASYNLSTGGLALRDQLIPIAGTRAITIPTNATTAFPIGTSIDFYQASGTGANFVAADGTVTILRTPGLTLRTTHSSATLTKVATNTWLLAGDLTA